MGLLPALLPCFFLLFLDPPDPDAGLPPKKASTSTVPDRNMRGDARSMYTTIWMWTGSAYGARAGVDLMMWILQ